MPVMKQVLSNSWVVLESLRPEHFEPLERVFSADEIWNLLPYRSGVSGFEQYFQFYLDASKSAKFQSYTIRDKINGDIAGLCSFEEYDRDQRNILVREIWIVPNQRGSKSFIAATNALLQHAIEDMRIKRVEFRCGASNKRSSAAFWKIGAKEEGILRSAFLHSDGTRSDIRVFSVLNSDWEHVKQQLDFLLSQ